MIINEQMWIDDVNTQFCGTSSSISRCTSSQTYHDSFRRLGKSAREEQTGRTSINNDNEEIEEIDLPCLPAVMEQSIRRRRRLECPSSSHLYFPPSRDQLSQKNVSSNINDGMEVQSNEQTQSETRLAITLIVKDVSRGTSKSIVVNGIVTASTTVAPGGQWNTGLAIVSADELCWTAMSAVGGEFWRGDVPGGRARLVHKGRDLLRCCRDMTGDCSVAVNVEGEVIYYCCLSP